MGRILVGMTISRTASAMVGVTMVLFALDRYRSPDMAGLVTFAAIAPGLLVSPIAGALLDRHGRARFIVLDLAVAAAALALIGGLAYADALPPAVLIAIAVVASLTQPLGATGLRSLFPLIVPRHLWTRANALDSNGYVVATLLGPPLAGMLVQLAGGPAAMLTIAAVYALSAVVLLRLPDPRGEIVTTGNLMRDALAGLLYTVRNPTLRSLAIGLSIANLAGGVTALVVPIVVIDRLGAGAALAGGVWAVNGAFAGISALLVGRLEWHGRERFMLAFPMAVTGLAWGALLFVPPSIALLFVIMAITGLLNGALDVALFSLRQRRTDPTWLGRAFAVSMALNFIGFPVGSAIGGVLVARSLDVAVWFVLGTSVSAAVLTWLTLPREGRPGRGVEGHPDEAGSRGS